MTVMISGLAGRMGPSVQSPYCRSTRSPASVTKRDTAFRVRKRRVDVLTRDGRGPGPLP
ncbi:hypothetical protein [Streptomyces sp. YIM S03343]